MIKIKENETENKSSSASTMTQHIRTGKIHVNLENNEEEIFDSYPITIKAKDIKHSIYEISRSKR